MKKGIGKYFALFLLACCITMVWNIDADAADLNGSCGKGVNWFYDEETTTLTISGNGAMMDFDYTGAPWSSVNSKITKVVIKDGVTQIGDFAFQYLKKVTSVIVPEGVTRIGRWSFSYMDKLTTVSLPDSVEVIDDYAFNGCEKLQEVDLPNQLQTIGVQAFRKCISLTKVTMYEGIQSIGQEAFTECDALISISMPDTVTVIGAGAFSSCDSLESARVSENLESLTNTFSYCKKLYSVNIPKNLKTMKYTFSNCYSLKNVVLPEGLKTIGESTFFGAGIEQLIVPESVTYIGQWAFYGINGKIAVLNPQCSIYNYEKNTLGTAGKTTIYCYEDSTAETIALKDGIAYYYITEDNLWTDKMDYYNPFVDVASGAFYYDAMLWAVNAGITTGTSVTTFSPNTTCTRAQVVTFLWRANGEPEPKILTSSFTDVKADAYYYKAMLWAVEENITTGTSATTFEPNKNCTRNQIVTFLWRSYGKPQASVTTHQFTDVSKSGYYYDAMLWAVEENITTGTTKTTFEPNKDCTRAQVVTFLYRADNN